MEISKLKIELPFLFFLLKNQKQDKQKQKQNKNKKILKLLNQYNGQLGNYVSNLIKPYFNWEYFCCTRVFHNSRKY